MFYTLIIYYLYILYIHLFTVYVCISGRSYPCVPRRAANPINLYRTVGLSGRKSLLTRGRH